MTVSPIMEAAAYPGFPEYAGFSSSGSMPPDHHADDNAATATAEDGLADAVSKRRNRRPPRSVGARFRALFEPSTNRLSMKIYGSEKAVLKERLRQRSLGVWVIHPCSKFRYVIVSS